MTSEETKKIAELELELLTAQRAQLAGRLKTPWWYVAGSAVVMAVVFATPIGVHYINVAGISLWSILLIIVMFYPLQHALTRVSGVALPMRTSQYPSTRPWRIAMPVLILAASAVEASLLKHGLLATAIVVGVLATLAGTGIWQGHLRGIRRDLETGKGPM